MLAGLQSVRAILQAEFSHLPELGCVTTTSLFCFCGQGLRKLWRKTHRKNGDGEDNKDENPLQEVEGGWRKLKADNAKELGYRNRHDGTGRRGDHGRQQKKGGRQVSSSLQTLRIGHSLKAGKKCQTKA
jgi:hypothetical protein